MKRLGGQALLEYALVVVVITTMLLSFFWFLYYSFTEP